MESKKRKVGILDQISEDRGVNRLVGDISLLKDNVEDLKKIVNLLMVQIKYQNNKINSLENNINSKDYSEDIIEITQLLRSQTINVESMDTEKRNSDKIYDYYA